VFWGILGRSNVNLPSMCNGLFTTAKKAQRYLVTVPATDIDRAVRRKKQYEQAPEKYRAEIELEELG